MFIVKDPAALGLPITVEPTVLNSGLLETRSSPEGKPLKAPQRLLGRSSKIPCDHALSQAPTLVLGSSP